MDFCLPQVGRRQRQSMLFGVGVSYILAAKFYIRVPSYDHNFQNKSMQNLKNVERNKLFIRTAATMTRNVNQVYGKQVQCSPSSKRVLLSNSKRYEKCRVKVRINPSMPNMSQICERIPVVLIEFENPGRPLKDCFNRSII